MSPDRTHAIVVAVETYEATTNLNGPARDAIEFAKWLIERNVPRKNIHLFAAPTSETAPEVDALKVDLHRADHVTLMNWLATTKLSGDLLLVLWGGHGLCVRERRHLVFPEGTKNLLYAIGWDSLQAVLRDAMDFPKQLCFVDACANYADIAGAKPEEVNRPNFPSRLTGVTQRVLFAASLGQRAVNPKGRGLFSSLLIDALAKTPSELWPPEIETVVTDLDKQFQELRQRGETKQAPAFYSCGDQHLYPPDSGILRALIRLSEALTEAEWEAGWVELENQLRGQDPQRDPEQWIRELSLDSTSTFAPLIVALRDQRAQKLFSFAQCRKLRRLFDDLDDSTRNNEDLSPETIFDRIWQSAGNGKPFAYASGFRACMQLAGLSKKPSPALEFLERIAAVEAGYAQKQLTTLCNEVAERLGLQSDLQQIRSIARGKSPRAESAALVFAIRVLGNRYSFESWFWPDGEIPQALAAPERKFSPSEIVPAARAALNEQLARVRAKKLRVEVALPRELLGEPVEIWNVTRGRDERPIHYIHPVLLRWTDRLDHPDLRDQWEDGWEAVPDQPFADTPKLLDPGCDVDKLRLALSFNPSARALVALGFSPAVCGSGADVLGIALNEGTPIVIWPRECQGENDPVCREIENLLKQPPRMLPDAIHEIRYKLAINGEQPRIALLYDDYTFLQMKEEG